MAASKAMDLTSIRWFKKLRDAGIPVDRCNYLVRQFNIGLFDAKRLNAEIACHQALQDKSIEV